MPVVVKPVGCAYTFLRIILLTVGACKEGKVPGALCSFRRKCESDRLVLDVLQGDKLISQTSISMPYSRL